MDGAGVPPDGTSYASVIRACAKAGEPKRALDLVQEIDRRGLRIVTDDDDYVAECHVRAPPRRPPSAALARRPPASPSRALAYTIAY